MIKLMSLILRENDTTTTTTTDYRGEHKAPDKSSGAPLYDMTKIYPDDIYSSDAARYYGDGEPAKDQQSISIIQGTRNRPNNPIRIYRAVPNVNKNIEKKIKRFSYLLYYIDKFGFPPLDDKAPKDVYKELGFRYGDVKYDKNKFIERVESQIKKLESSKQDKLTLNPGDWVTINRQYAIEHGESLLLGKYKILTKVVPAKYLYTDAGSIHEFGYDPL